VKLLPAGPAHEREGGRGREGMAAAGFLLAVALGLAAASSPAGAGTVVVLRSRALGVYDSLAAGFRASYRGSVADLVLGEADDPALGSRIAALHPDVVVAVGLRAALFTRDQLARTPLVFCAVQQPERRGLQGVWVTGVSGDVPPETELAALKTAAPDVRRVVLFYGRGSGAPFARAARAAAASLELELIEVPLADLSELAGAVRGATEGADALWLPPDPVVAAPEAFHFLLKLSLDRRIPLLTFSDALVRAGALAAACPDFNVVGEQLAEIVRRIQAGERPGDIPVSRARRVRWWFNRSTARALGRELPLVAVKGGEVVP